MDFGFFVAVGSDRKYYNRPIIRLIIRNSPDRISKGMNRESEKATAKENDRTSDSTDLLFIFTLSIKSDS